MNYKLIIFDLDDTLFDYRATEMHAFRGACSAQGIPFSAENYITYKRANDVAKKELPNYMLNLSEFRRKRVSIFFGLIGNHSANGGKFIEDYLKLSEDGILIEGVFDTISTLHPDINVAVATNGSDYPRKNKLFGSKIACYVDRYYSSDNMGVMKPDAVFFDKIISDFFVNKNEVLSVGDDWDTDVIGSVNEGIACCWFNWKNNFIPSELPANVKIITAFKEIKEAMRRNNEKIY